VVQDSVQTLSYGQLLLIKLYT
jgi:hypothetical protein